jgi:hypothetical protein
VPPEVSLQQVSRDAMQAAWNKASLSLPGGLFRLPIMFSARLVATDNGFPVRLYKAGDAAAIYLPEGRHEVTIERVEHPIGVQLALLGLIALAALPIAAAIAKRGRQRGWLSDNASSLSV